MSKTYRPTAAFKKSRQNREAAEKLLRRAIRIGVDPRNTVNTASALFNRVMPATEVVKGKRVWKV